MVQLVFVSTPVHGHFAPLGLVAADLVGRGHQAVFITAPAFAQGVASTGARFVPTHGAAAFTMDELHAERDLFPAGPQQLIWDMQRIFIDPVPVQHELVQRELRRAGDEPVVLITDSWCLAGWPAALGAPGPRPTATIGIGISVLPVTSTDAGPFGLGMAPDASPAGRERNREVTAEYRATFAPAQQHLAEVLRGLGATQEPPFFHDGLAGLHDRTLQLCPAGFEYPRSDAPRGVRYVGALPAPAADRADALPAWWHEVEQAERVVVVTQGTLANRDASALFEPALRALTDLGALVVVTTGRGGAVLHDVPAGARVAEFIPFDQLLPHTDVLVTNGGFGGVLQSLAHGVPMVVAGDTEDKPEVGARVAWTGAGIDLGTGHPSDAALADAVRTVLDDPAYARAARRLQAESAGHDPFEEVAAQVDELLEEAHEPVTASS